MTTIVNRILDSTAYALRLLCGAVVAVVLSSTAFLSCVFISQLDGAQIKMMSTNVVADITIESCVFVMIKSILSFVFFFGLVHYAGIAVKRACRRWTTMTAKANLDRIVSLFHLFCGVVVALVASTVDHATLTFHPAAGRRCQTCSCACARHCKLCVLYGKTHAFVRGSFLCMRRASASASAFKRNSIQGDLLMLTNFSFRHNALMQNSVEEVTDVAVVVNTEDMDYSNDDDDDSSCSTSIIHHDEPLKNVELKEDCSSNDEDSSSVGSFGYHAGSGDADVPVQTEPPCATEAQSSTVPCAQPSQRCRTRPFLARRAKEGSKRYT